MMAGRVVAAFRYANLSVPLEQSVQDLRRVLECGHAAGGQMCAASGDEFAFEFEFFAHAFQATRSALETCSSIAAGIGVGELERATLEQPATTITRGPGLERAVTLARYAERGELLLDPLVAELPGGDFEPDGERAVVLSKTRCMAGLVSLQRKPSLASSLADVSTHNSRTLREAPFLGRDEINELVVEPGQLAVVRAPSGMGGSRVLEELSRLYAPAAVLRIEQHPLGVPLGALARALSRAFSDLGRSRLPAELSGALRSLVKGQGADAETCVQLILAALGSSESRDDPGIVIIDDASFVDADSLAAVARAWQAASPQFRIVLRLTPKSNVPRCFGEVVVGKELSLQALSAEHTKHLIRAMLGEGQSEPELEARIGATAGAPLLVRECLLDGLEGGAENGQREPHVLEVIARRLWRLPPPQRAAIKAMAILGGEASVPLLQGVLSARADASIDLASTIQFLYDADWVRTDGPHVVRFEARTHAIAVMTTLSQEERREWDQRATQVLAETGQPMNLVRAALHAILANEGARARDLCLQVLESIEALGLSDTAAALRQYVESGDKHGLYRQGLLPRRPASPQPQTEVAKQSPPEAKAESPTPSGDEAAATLEPQEETPQEATQVRVASSPPEDAQPRPSMPPSEPHRAAEAVAAMRTGDVGAIERIVSQLRGEQHDKLADRLEAMATLAKGDVGAALRRLRQGSSEARTEKSPNGCRAALALGVGLAVAGRRTPATLAALEGLARARETDDKRGEEACARFLSMLARTSGDEGAAATWEGVAQLAAQSVVSVAP